ncbi:MAG TPA: type II toxin-antitoxin system RelE/ParE family toxin [Prolixibacteraceae bacterium]|jgi:plasmid stabilization system protein ParE
MSKYRITIDTEALYDIQDIANWYDMQKAGFGKRFQNTIIKQIEELADNPKVFAIRYKEIRCMLVKKFPYMVHFYLNPKNSTIEILAVISTVRNPNVWEEKTARI